MDIEFNSNGSSKQVGNLTVFIGSDPFLPQPESPTVEPKVITVDEQLNTPPPPSTTPEYPPENLTKPSHPYLEADICLDTESRQILQTPSSPLDKDPPLIDLSPIDPVIFVSPPKKGKKPHQQPQSHLMGLITIYSIAERPPQFLLLSFLHHLKGATHQLDLSSLFNLYIFRPVTRKSWPNPHNSCSSL